MAWCHRKKTKTANPPPARRRAPHRPPPRRAQRAPALDRTVSRPRGPRDLGRDTGENPGRMASKSNAIAFGFSTAHRFSRPSAQVRSKTACKRAPRTARRIFETYLDPRAPTGSAPPRDRGTPLAARTARQPRAPHRPTRVHANVCRIRGSRSDRSTRAVRAVRRGCRGASPPRGARHSRGAVSSPVSSPGEGLSPRDTRDATMNARRSSHVSQIRRGQPISSKKRPALPRAPSTPAPITGRQRKEQHAALIRGDSIRHTDRPRARHELTRGTHTRTPQVGELWFLFH